VILLESVTHRSWDGLPDPGACLPRAAAGVGHPLLARGVRLEGAAQLQDADGPGHRDEQHARQANDNDADSYARRFAESLEEAVLDLELGENGFERATRKADHVEELRRVLGILLDILADWELVAERARSG